MNSNNFDSDYVEQLRSYPPRQFTGPQTASNQSEVTLRAARDDHQTEDDLNGELDYVSASGRPESASPQPTVVPVVAPSPPFSTSSESDLYGRGLFSAGVPLHPTGEAYVPASGSAMQFQPTPKVPEWEANLNAAMLTGFRDELAREAGGTITPGIDDTPYLHYAIETITRDRDTGYSGNASSSSDEDKTVPRFVPGPGQEFSYQTAPPVQSYHAPVSVPFPAAAAPPERTAAQSNAQGSRGGQAQSPWYMKLGAFQMPGQTPPPESNLPPPRKPAEWQPPDPRQWIYMNREAMSDPTSEKIAEGYALLNYKPSLLRSVSFAGMIGLTVLMIAGLVFSAVFSQLHDGLWQYSGDNAGGQYFLFRFVPQLLAAFILIYAQRVVMTIFRILPFVHLASDRSDLRREAIFEDLYPSTFLWPQLIGTWEVWFVILSTWLLNFTIPLQSALFTVILRDNVWTWATVQGVVWTLVALYLVFAVSLVVAWKYWASIEMTGLLWNPVSIADLAVMVSSTNLAPYYRGTDVAMTKETIEFILRRRPSERLGYWRWANGRDGFWYGIGTPEIPEEIPDEAALKGRGMAGDEESQIVHDLEAAARISQIRHHYLPWCLRSSPLIYSVFIAFFLLVALFVVSFLPSTSVTRGFLPSLSAQPGAGAFSAADFLWSFLPSLLGMILFLLFQSLDLSLRTLQPWATLSQPKGARAEHSLLADYATWMPLPSFSAFAHGHWRVAVISTLSSCFLAIPVVAGGVFMALTPPNAQVRTYPNVPAFAIVLVLLVLYFLALVSLLPGRHDFRLPHAVSCLAEVIAFLANRDLLDDRAFRDCRTRTDLLAKLGLGRDSPATQPRWHFSFGVEPGVGPGAGPGDRLGVRRMRRYTEKRHVRKSQIRRDGASATGSGAGVVGAEAPVPT